MAGLSQKGQWHQIRTPIVQNKARFDNPMPD
jgi:hypothetical protein